MCCFLQMGGKTLHQQKDYYLFYCNTCFIAVVRNYATVTLRYACKRKGCHVGLMASLCGRILLQRATSVNFWFPQNPTYDQGKWDASDIAAWKWCNIERDRNTNFMARMCQVYLYDVSVFNEGKVYPQTCTSLLLWQRFCRVWSRSLFVIFPKSFKTQHSGTNTKAWFLVSLTKIIIEPKNYKCWKWKGFWGLYSYW